MRNKRDGWASWVKVLVLCGCVWSIFGNDRTQVHQFSTLFTAHDVKNHLSTSEGRQKALEWCRKTSVRKVYVETFRDGYQATEESLRTARDEFRKAGLEVSGCVTTTQVGKKSTGWNLISCYTDLPTQERIREIFEFTAGLFDEIMIDDFWFTDCACEECTKGRDAQVVKIGTKEFKAADKSWPAYRGELMLRLSEGYVIGATKRVNPKARLIIKYPQWYDQFHERGYDVGRETEAFDVIWVGTETRDYNDKRWGGTVQYEAYFIMRWLGGIGGEKSGGGWYDWLGTTEKTYIEQARQTVLAGARESVLFCYSGLQGTTGPPNVEVLREHIPELQRVATEVQKRKPVGIAAYKPANSPAGKEARVFDFVGMLGLPLAPCHEFPRNAPALFLSVHALKDPQAKSAFAEYARSGRPVLVTDGFAKENEGAAELRLANVKVLKVGGNPKSLLEMTEPSANELRKPLLAPFKAELQAPVGVGVYLFEDGSWVLENFNDTSAEVQWNGAKRTMAPRSWQMEWK